MRMSYSRRALTELAAYVNGGGHGKFGDLRVITPAAAFPLQIQRGGAS